MLGTTQSYFLYYFIIISTSIALYISEIFRKAQYKKISKLLFVLSIILPITILAIRYNIGTDYVNYARNYYQITSYSNIFTAFTSTHKEPIWIAFNFTVKYIFDDFRYLIYISSILTWAIIFKGIYKQKDSISIVIASLIALCTLYNASFNIIRQVLAASLLLYSINYVERKQFSKFLVITLIAVGIHYISLMFLPVYWVINSNKKVAVPFKKRLFLIVSILVVFFYQPILSFMGNFEILSKYSRIYQLSYSGIGFGTFIIKLPIIIIMLFNLKKMKSKHDFYHKLSILYFSSVVLDLFGYMAEYLDRISLFYEMSQIYLLASILKLVNKKEKFLYTFIIVSYYLALFTYEIIIRNQHRTIPYEFLL